MSLFFKGPDIIGCKQVLREATLLCGPEVDTSFIQGEGVDPKKKKGRYVTHQKKT